MRIAFLTPEYPSEYDSHGLGTYVHRMADVLVQFGHEPEVFVSSRHASERFTHDGIYVHRVNWKESQPIFRALSSTAKGEGLGSSSDDKNQPVQSPLFSIRKMSDRFHRWRQVAKSVLDARALAWTLERRHVETPFSIVQSADFLAAGLFVRRRRDRVHVVRCSYARDLYSNAEGYTSNADWVTGHIERLSMRRADLAYAPSRYVAHHFKHVHRIDVQVIRPPRHIEIHKLSPATTPLPARFFFHFGQLKELKGTALLAQALPLAWKAVPDLTMVWSGPCWSDRKIDYWRSLWGDRAQQVYITGPLSKSELYAILARADAAVLPSLVDNLPNTVIESLMFGVPVIGSRGASIDELVDEGRNGHLVDVGDKDDLAEALIKMWKGKSPVCKGFEWSAAVAEEMKPERAVANLVALARTSH